jgi:glycosyltransferase involved in cell wall biosynthesis
VTRIAFLLPDLQAGGIQVATLALGAAMRERGVAVDVVVLDGGGPLAARIDPRLGLVDLGTGRLRRSVGALHRYFATARPDAVIAAPALLAAGALRARRNLVTPPAVIAAIHTNLPEAHRQLGLVRGRVVTAVLGRALREADGVVAVSRGAGLDAAGLFGMPPESIRVIPNGFIDAGFAARIAAESAHAWFRDGGPPTVLAVGRLVAQKDHRALIAAVAQVRRTVECRLVVLGEGPLRAALEAAVGDEGLEGAVDLPGTLDDPLPLMARCSVFAMSSRFEGLPVVLGEALACGAPIVSTDCPHGPREILADGEYGSLVPVGDVDALAAAIEERIRMGRRPIPPEATARFHVDAAADAYLRFVAEVETRRVARG